jgi:GAF domain-containing protein
MLLEDENGQLLTTDPFDFEQVRGDRAKLHGDEIYRSLLSLQASQNENDAIARATQIIGAALKADCYGVMLLDPARAALYCHPSARGGCGHVDMLPLTAKSIVTKVFNAGRSIRLSNARLDPNYYPIDREIRSELCVPLKTSTGCLGVINVESKCPDAFTLDDERWLMNVAAQLAAAIERTRSKKP